MNWVVGIGYLASALVFATFCMRTMIPLRLAAICSNIAFVVYGFFGGIYPVLLLHVVLLATSIALVTSGWVYDVALGCQLAFGLAAFAGVGIARYYALVTWATNVALWNYLRRGVPATWEPARE